MADTGAPGIAPGSRERSGVGPGVVFALSVIGAGDCDTAESALAEVANTSAARPKKGNIFMRLRLGAHA